MKKLIALILVLSMGAASADVVSPLPTVVQSLDGMLQPTSARKTLTDMKAVANERNTDIDEAMENYIIAKKNVNVARAQFSPITTGHLLGVAMGIPYLWAPLAIDAVLSIPTKIYGVSKNKSLARSAEYNLYDARQQINNELAHLYYDILTHEVILKTIDLEMQILTYQEAKWIQNQYSAVRLADQRKWILRLGMERVDIYKMYAAELAAIRTLISTTDGTAYELTQNPTELNKSIIDGLELEKLQNFSLRNSNKYKSSIHLSHAADANVKQVKWSVISISGLSFAYKRKVKEAKNEARIAELRMESVAKEVKTNVLLQVSKLDSNLDVFDNYNSVSNASLGIFEDTLQSYGLGQLSEDSVIETALGAIRDFRSKVVSHYIAWSSLDDFSTSANYDFAINPKFEDKAVQSQVELDPLYRLEEDSFTVKMKEGENLSIYLSSPKIGTVSSVDYTFNDETLGTKSSDIGKTNYAVYIVGKTAPADLSGVANVTLDNGHEFKVNFTIKK
jgi:hypothetical protein